MRLVSIQKQYFFGMTQKLSFEIFKIEKVFSYYLLSLHTEIKEVSKFTDSHYISSEKNPAHLSARTRSVFYTPKNFRSKGDQY